MPFVQFWEYSPDVAARETRSITIPPGSPLGLPSGDYAKWMKSGDKADAVRLKGPQQNPLSPATELAPALREVVRNILLQDPEYVERIKKHYQMFRDKIGRPKKSQRRRPRRR